MGSNTKMRRYTAATADIKHLADYTGHRFHCRWNERGLEADLTASPSLVVDWHNGGIVIFGENALEQGSFNFGYIHDPAACEKCREE